MKFIDLFAGLGGFHEGFTQEGGQCVFACEIDEELRDLYFKNFGIKPAGDIRQIKAKDIPKHDVICAGFPCQPFSLAGKKKGASCPESGKLIEDVVRIARYHRPKYVVLENVPNILTIENGVFWKNMQNKFSRAGYQLEFKVISPEDVGIPQSRKRVFIVGTHRKFSTSSFRWPKFGRFKSKQLQEYLDNNKPHKRLEPQKEAQLSHWQKLLDRISIPNLRATSIVAPEFGANYPLDFRHLSIQSMTKYRGAYGQSLKSCTSWSEILAKLPSYTRKNRGVPAWILQSVNFSRLLFSKNRSLLNQWKRELNREYNSWQILEWRSDSQNLNLGSHLIQFRASGIRVSRLDRAPSLISMTLTQTPIIYSEKRYISTYEAARLQNLHKLKRIPHVTSKAFKALGNAVNAKVVELIAREVKRLAVERSI